MSAGQFRTIARLLAACSALALAGCATGAPPEWTKIEGVQSPVSNLTRTDGLYGDAVAAINRRDYGAALEKLHAARQAQPGDARVLNALAVVYDKLGRFDLSQRYYGQAAQADPSSPIVQANLAYSRSLQAKSGAGVTQLAQAPVETVSATENAVSAAPQPVQVTEASRPAAPALSPVVSSVQVIGGHAALVQAADRPGEVRFGRTRLWAELTSAIETAVPSIPVMLRAVPAPIGSEPSVISAKVASDARPQRLPRASDPDMQPAEPAPPIFARNAIRPAPALSTVAAVATPVAARPLSPQLVSRKIVLDAPERAVVPQVTASANPDPGSPRRTAAARAPATGFRIAAAPAPLVVAAPSAAQARARQASYAARTGRAPLMVVNATGQWRRGEDVRASLAGLGWSAPRWAYASQPMQARSVIYYPSNRLPIARALAATLPGRARLVPCDRACAGVQLVLGADAQRWKVRGA